MSKEHLEELAALHAVGLLEETAQTELHQAMKRDPEIGHLVDNYARTAAWLAYDAPVVTPPDALKRDILGQLPRQKSEAKVIAFSTWIPYAIAACLMVLGLSQGRQIIALKAKLRTADTTVAKLNESNTLMGLRLAELESKDAAYVSAKVMVAWDPTQNHGLVSVQNLPIPPVGHDYQLWVLDPTAQTPLSAGLIRAQTGSHTFGSQALNTTRPGFAISMEPTGGSVTPTGAILFAVAPGP